MVCFERADSAIILISPIVPIPASAAPAPPSPKTGMIRLIDPKNPSVKTYLSRSLQAAGGYLVSSQDTSDALLVEYDPLGSSNTLSAKVIILL